MDQSPTRSVLLETKNKVKLASKGRSLLKKKQDVLMNKLFGYIKQYKAKRAGVVEKVKKAYGSLTVDMAYSGIASARSASYATKDIFDFTFDQQNIMGVKFPTLQVSEGKNPVTPKEISPLMKVATTEFQELFKSLVELSVLEETIKRLSEEIVKTKRRVNSLEHIKIPEMQAQVKEIKFFLEEQDREAFSRLKFIKEKLEQKNNEVPAK